MPLLSMWYLLGSEIEEYLLLLFRFGFSVWNLRRVLELYHPGSCFQLTSLKSALPWVDINQKSRSHMTSPGFPP